MPTNLLKVYNEFLELTHLSERDKIDSLKLVFNRDIVENDNFKFNSKVIRPVKKDGLASLETLFTHLTCEAETCIDSNGVVFSKRKRFEIERSKRLHWLKYHVEQKKLNNLKIFSYEDKIKGRGKTIRTYIYDYVEKYVIILEPQKSEQDYYLITAYFLTNEKGGVKQIENKHRKKLEVLH